MTIGAKLRATARRLDSTPFPGPPLLLFIVILLLGGGGCASFLSRVLNDNPPPPTIYPTIPAYVEAYKSKQPPGPALTAFLIIDAPLSLALDTLLFPIDLAAQLSWDHQQAEEMKRNKQTGPVLATRAQ